MNVKELFNYLLHKDEKKEVVLNFDSIDFEIELKNIHETKDKIIIDGNGRWSADDD